jgi:hypothetical protein
MGIPKTVEPKATNGLKSGGPWLPKVSQGDFKH